MLYRNLKKMLRIMPFFLLFLIINMAVIQYGTFDIISTKYGYCSTITGNLANNLPLGLYLSKDNYNQIKQWYSSRKGESYRFNFNKPEKYYLPIQRALRKNETIDENEYKRPSGIWHVTACAFCFALTGNMEAGNAVREMLLHFSGFRNWKKHPAAIAPFEESLIILQMVISYDLIYSILSETDKKIIATAIEVNGLQPIKKHVIEGNRWTTKEQPYNGNPGFLQHSNQAPTFLGAMYLSSRLLYHYTNDDKYKNQYIMTARAIQSFLRKYFPEDGSVTAATGYYLRTIQELSYIIQPMASSLGMAIDEFLPHGAKNPFTYAMYLRSMAVPKGIDAEKIPLLINFGDSSYNSLVYNPFTKKTIGNKYYGIAVWSALINDPDLAWIYKTYVKDLKLKFNESAVSLVSHYYRFIKENQTQYVKPKVELEHLFKKSGLYIWRDSFVQGDKLFALSKRGFYRGDHLHNDQNNFLLEAFGERYFTDLGVNYKLEKKRGFSKSINHNTITINRQDNKDGRNRQKITPYLTTEFLNYARSDSSYIKQEDPLEKLRNGYTSKNTDHMVRSVIYLKPNYYVIGDSIHNLKKEKVECNFVSSCPLDIKDKYIQYQGKNSSCFQFLAASTNIVMKQRQLLDDSDNIIYGLSAETALGVNQVSFLNFLYPTNHKQIPLIKKETNETGISIKIINKGVDDQIVQKGDRVKDVKIGDIQSDCEYIVLRKRKNIITCIGFFQGTFLKIKGHRIIQTDKKASLICYLLKNNVFGESISPERTLVNFQMFNDPIILTLSETDEDGYSSFASLR
ncbi:MAG: heparinase II/III family protein [Deltaproteobacteria bacterium]|nr:heparinase II/III family protein [Deltaproteobacteria bacterium]